MFRKGVIAIFAAVAVLAALPAPADDGATPIPFTDPYTTPQILTTPGHYVVTRNLLPAPAGPIIIVECDAVTSPPAPAFTIDLNGMVLDNTGGAEEVILILGNPICEVVIRNGEVIGGLMGIHAPVGLRKLVVEDVEVKESAAEGIIGGDVQNFAIRRNAVIETGGMGIVMWGAMQPKDGIIEDNIVRRTHGGIYVDIAEGLEVSNNRVNEIFPGPFDGVGIYLMDVGSCLVTQNNVAMVQNLAGGMGGHGIGLFEGSRCKLYNNTVERTDSHGIYIDPNSGDNLLLDNHVRDAMGDGIHIESSRNHVQRNVANWCAGIGIYYFGNALQNSVGRNYGGGNGWGGPPMCFPAFPDFCDNTGTFITQGDNVFVGGPF